MTKARRPIVGVMGSGSDPDESRSTALGEWLARFGAHLLTGGGGGVMGSVSRAFHDSPAPRGSVIGIIPSGLVAGEAKVGYPNPWVEIPIATHLPLSGHQGSDPGSRNHINVLTSDVIVALAGGAGTASEVALAVSYGKPIIAFVSSAEDIPGLPASVERSGELSEVCSFVRRTLEARGLA